MLICGVQYDDAEGAIRWLQDALGFEPTMTVPGQDGRAVAHAELRRGEDTWLMVGTTRPPGDPYAGDVPYLVVDDLDAAFAQARAAGAEVVEEIRQETYGRFFAVRDPQGRVWSVGDYRPAAGGDAAPGSV
ncbi:MAG TPA: VOC family protein [Baekduia sp.]|nr:VOC family protein [Baekduia sp.]